MSGSGPAPRHPRAPSLLVVETSPLLAERLARLARACGGVTIAVAESGAAALSQLRTASFDVVVVDVDGLRWPDLPELGEMRAARPDALLMALTADFERETVSACRARGAELVLDLNGDLEELSGVLRARLGSD